MGLLKAAGSAVGGVLADQWKDFYTVPDGLAPTAALFPAVRRGTNLGRGSNTRGSVDVITNGSTIVVPQGYGLVFMEGGAFTAFVAEPGVYEWSSAARDSRSVFAAGNLVDPLITASWERFKYGGRPAAQQRAFFVSLQELTNNKFGTASDIYWDDRYLNAQVGASARGTYTLRITDPLLFIHNFVPASYLQNGAVFDFTDLRNAAADQLFNEVIASLSTALSADTNDPARGNRIIGIQQDAAGFARCLAQAVEANYHWRSERGLEIVSTRDHRHRLRRPVTGTAQGRAARRRPHRGAGNGESSGRHRRRHRNRWRQRRHRRSHRHRHGHRHRRHPRPRATSDRRPRR